MKKLILLPVLLLALAACTPGTSSEVSSSSEASSSSASSEASSSASSSSISSSSFVADTRVWSIVGSFGTSAWNNAGTDYDLTRVSEFVDQFEITLDLFVGEEFAIIHDRSWDGQLGYATINSMTPEACMIEGGGYAVKNAQTAVAGNYHIVLDTTNHYVPHIAVTRLGDPLVVPTEELWRLAGSFNAWTNPDDAYLLVETATVGTFEITLDLYVDVNFKVVKNGASWFGFDKVGTITPEGAITDNGGNINVTLDGSYVIQVVSGDAIVINITRVGDPIVPPPAEVFWRLFGSFNSWTNPDDAYLMVETSTLGTYEFTLDLYVGNAFKAVKNETIYVGAGALGTVEPLACVGGTDNIEVAVDGNYKIQVVDAETDVVNVTRLSDPIVPAVGEVDNGGWYLTGTINSWDIADSTTYALLPVEGQEHTYAQTFDFAADDQFDVNAGGTWDLKRGPSKVATDPVPAGIDLTGSDIKVTVAGSYKVTFIWATALGGSIVIEQLSVVPPVVEPLIATYDLSDQVRTAYVDGVNNKYLAGAFAPFLQSKIAVGGTEKLVSSSGETNVYTAAQSISATGPQFNGIKFGSSSANGTVTLTFAAGTGINKVVVGCAGWASPNTDTLTVGGVTLTPTQGGAAATVEAMEFTFADTDTITITTAKRIIINYIAIYHVAA